MGAEIFACLILASCGTAFVVALHELWTDPVTEETDLQDVVRIMTSETLPVVIYAHKDNDPLSYTQGRIFREAAARMRGEARFLLWTGTSSTGIEPILVNLWLPPKKVGNTDVTMPSWAGHTILRPCATTESLCRDLANACVELWQQSKYQRLEYLNQRSPIEGLQLTDFDQLLS